MLDALAGEREVVLERIVLAAALARRGGVTYCIAECVCLLARFCRSRFFEREAQCGVEVGQGDFQ